VDLHRRTGATSVYVTHDQAEAMAMSDRIVVMNHGRIVEVGTPVTLYRSPVTAFTAGFLGQTNLVELAAEGTVGRLPWGRTVPLALPARGPIQVSIRPETIGLKAAEDGEGEVTAVSFMGPNAVYAVRVGGTSLKVSQAGGDRILDIGDRVRLDFAAPLHVLEGAAPLAEAA